MSKIIDEVFVPDATQRVLTFFCQNPSASLHDSAVARRIKNLSLASVNNALRKLAAADLLERKREGRQT